MTEALSFPISSVMDIGEEPEFNQVPQGTAARAGGSSGSSRRCLPFARGLFAKQEESCETSGPPHPHLVVVRVRGAVAGRMHSTAERAPAHMRLNAQPLPMIQVTLCFAEKDEALQLVSKVQAYKRYHLAVTLSTYVHAFAAASQRESQRRSCTPAEVGAMACRLQASPLSVEPPPLPPRPRDLPPAQRLPRMVSNEEGEVFWYIPRKPTVRSQRPDAPGMVPLPQPECLDERTPPPPRDVSAGQEDSADGLLDVSSKDSPQTRRARSPATSDPEDVHATETPAPCLVSPTPAPGRPLHSHW